MFDELRSRLKDYSIASHATLIILIRCGAVRESTCDVRTAIELIFPSPACLFCFSFSRTSLLGIISKWFSDPPTAKNPRFISLIKLNSHFYSGYASCGCEVHCRPFSFLTYIEIVAIEGCIWLRRKSHASCISADKFAKYCRILNREWWILYDFQW